MGAEKDGAEKTVVLDAIRDQTLRDLNRITNTSTNDLVQQVERYVVVVGELFGASRQRCPRAELHRFGAEKRQSRPATKCEE